MNFKSLMLGAAAVAAATSAQAADLPVAAEPVDYVKVCDAYGARFYYIPGTDTCLRVGGRVRAEYKVNNFASDAASAWKNHGSDGYNFTAKGYLYLDSRTNTEFGLLRTFTEFEMANTNASESFGLGKAFIQWGGLTFGHATSFFDYFTGQAYMGVVGRNWSDTTVNLAAYTAAFGNGFSATLSIEDGDFRQSGAYGGNRIPDVVANLRVDQGWGSAQLSGALHHVNPAVNTTKNHTGYAIQGGVTINLPMLSSKSNIAFQAAYADGAMSYLGAPSTVSDYNGNKTNKGYNFGGGIYHQATSTVGLALDGSYLYVDVANSAFDASRWAIDGSVVWEPVSGLQIGADMGYASTDVKKTKTGDLDELLFGVRVQRTF